MTVIRSLTSREGDHERATCYLKTGYRMDPTLVHPSIGAILAHQLPSPNLEVPAHVSIGEGPFPARGGFLGDRFDAFRVLDSREGLDNVEPRVPEDQMARRLENLRVVEESFRRSHPFAEDVTLHDSNTRDALTLMSSEQLAAFRIENEPEAIRKPFGETPFGMGCLVALRLIETGVRSVEVTLDGFDSHVNNLETQKARAESLDPALASLIQQLKQRDLFGSTILLVIGEFGRAPRINPLEGRDHWPHGFSCLVGGGGLRGGQVIGSTDPQGEKKEPEDPIQVNDLYSTILSQFGVDPHKEMMTDVGRPMAFSDGAVLARLMKA